MQFLHPTYLWGFLLILIPIIIHLFQLRKYRVVYFSSLKFLKQLDIEQKRKSRIRDLLLLIVRILLISMLVLAFAHPFIPGKTDSQTTNQTIGLYLDNSLSMENEADGQSLFDHAKRAAIETVENYPPDTRFFLLQNDDIFASKYPLEKKDVIRSIELLNLSPLSTDLGKIILRFQQIVEVDNKNIKPILFVFSDLQQTFIKRETVPDSIPYSTILIKLPQGNSNNIYIDSCWFNSPIQNAEKRHTIHARINNSSDRNLQRFPVSLLIRDSLVAQETVNLEAYSTAELEFSYNMSISGWHQGTIEIRDYPVSFDNLFHFAYYISDKIPVLQIFSEQENTHLRALFESDTYFDYSQAEADAIPYQDLKKFQFIVLNSLSDLSRNLSELLLDYVDKGGSLLVLPPEDGKTSKLNSFLQKLNSPVYGNLLERVSEARIPRQMKTFYEQVSMNPDQQVEWPNYTRYYRISDQSSGSNAILINETGKALLSRTGYGEGYVCISAAPLTDDFTNFQLHPLFIPFLYFLANTGMEDQELYSRIGQIAPISVNIDNAPNMGPARVISSEGLFDAIPKQFRDPITGRLMIYLTDYSAPAGILKVLRTERTEGTEAMIAVNYTREESQVEQLSSDNLITLIEEIASVNLKLSENNYQDNKSSANKNKGKTFSLIRLLLLFAIIFLIAESLIHRFKT